ncbi:MAG: hypothetical protein JSR67_11560 [Proteobacteria bacterium]|nr:hypothetical protein [Pseudomonadota bacterium]
MATSITPVMADDLPALGEFLNLHLNARISAAHWTAALQHPWCAARPNFGMQLHDGARLVGAFCAIYSDQVIAGRQEKFCNPHSWCVLPEYRNQGIGLLTTLLRQPGYHFTMLTPNPKVAQIFRQLRFRDLADDQVVFPNLPSIRALSGSAFAACEPAVIATRLRGAVLRDYELHRDIPWLRFAVFGAADEACLAVYKPMTLKRLPGARLLHISEPRLFERHGALLRHHLLTHHGLAFSRIETRFLERAPRLALHQRRLQGKLFLSKTLGEGQIRDLYSELVALDI